MLEKNFPPGHPIYLIPIHRDNHWACAVIIAPVTPELSLTKDKGKGKNQLKIQFNCILKPKIFFFDSAYHVSPEICQKLRQICLYIFGKETI